MASAAEAAAATAAKSTVINLDSLPESLKTPVQRAWESIVSRLTADRQADLESALGDPLRNSELSRVLACSRYAVECFSRRPELLLDLLRSDDLTLTYPEDTYRERLQAELESESAVPGVVLRRFRQREMLRIIWRDLNRLAPTLETTRDVSLLAEASIEAALQLNMAELVKKFGQPIGRASGEPQTLIVIAMGKLGARELNLSSDIDLIFTFPEGGETRGAPRSLSNEEFFTRVGRGLISLLDPVTAEGFVFRVDMRLRPYGESGALVHSFAALEGYYQEQGRDWERYALVKARPLTGSAAQLEELMECLRPFVYRRYVDYSAIESLRSMKQLIVNEVRRRGLQGNVKLGSGGIREVEFIAQCFQLIRGGRDLSLQTRELVPALAECAALGCLPESAAQALTQAYLFLRDVEHAIQAWEDKQTQELPGEALAQTALAYALSCRDYAHFLGELDAHRGVVSKHFMALIAEVEQDDEAAENADLWSADCDVERLRELGFQEPESLAERLSELYASRRIQELQIEGRERLDRFMPLLLDACADLPSPDLAIDRALPLVSAVARRSAYLLLLIENPPALADLVSLCHGSPWIAEQLVSQPVLLDDLLDRASLSEAPDKETLRSELRQQVARLHTDDLEGYMEALRYFKASQVLRVAASELAGRLPLMKVSDKLSFIAEVCLEQVLNLAWAQLSARHGEPSRDGEGLGFVIVAYGKLGGIELSYASDLDLVFVYDAPPTGSTDGERPIDNATFFTRLGQRIIHILEARTGLGQLYEADMRLRPSGASGMLVTSLTAFEQYQKQEAWTWEHQALVRARAIAGDALLAERFESVRRAVLCQPREPLDVAIDVVRMRNKMRENQPSAAVAGDFDLKHGPGGIVDIEFMVQYAVLAWASREATLADWSDNVRILETLLSTELLPRSECQHLENAYLEMRSALHRLALQQQGSVLSEEDYAAQRDGVSDIWSRLFGDVTRAHLR
ncbi:MAG: bifunctional [glutamate--ammonia ligase]-adenylyl-L-tyrosine phosphorylase/[glutamate--ammonia-ligase] adenylyltransferase [Congregibacter sp.]